MKKTLPILFVIFGIVIFFFRPYFFSGKLLFPSNLLVAFYPPWDSMKFSGWEQGIPFKGLGHDNLLIFYPMKHLLRQSLGEHSFPFWTPYNFAGGPLFGDGQSAVLYPFTYLYTLLSLPDGFSVMVLLVPTITMIGMYGMLRQFKLARVAALFGAFVFAFSGFMSVWMEENPAVSQSAIWLPFLIWMLDLFITTEKAKWFSLLTIITAIMMSSGFLQICLYELVLIAVYGVYRVSILPENSDVKRRRGLLSAVAVLCGILFVSPYLAVTWEGYKLSPRDFVDVPEIRSIFLVPWSHILSLFNPDWLGNPGSYNYLGTGSYYDKALFVGVVPLVFVLLHIFVKKTSREVFFWTGAIASLVMGISSPFTQWLFSTNIPILTTMLPSRVFYITSFCLSVIAAYQFHRLSVQSSWVRRDLRIRNVAAVYIAILIFFEIFIIVLFTELHVPTYPIGEYASSIRRFLVPQVFISEVVYTVTVRNIVVSFGLSLIALVCIYLGRTFSNFTKPLLLVLFVISVFSGWYFTNKSLYFGERLFVYPEHELIRQLQAIAGWDRVGYAHDKSRIRSGVNAVYGLYSPEGLNPVFAYRYGQLVKSAVSDGLLVRDIPRISVEVDIEQATKGPLVKHRIERLLSLLSVRYITERKESGWYVKTFPDHVSVYEGEKFRIWKNPLALPRAYIVHSVTEIRDPQQILNTLYSNDVDLRSTAVIEKSLNIPMNDSIGGREVDSVSLTQYRMNDLVIQVHATQSGLVVLTDTYAPGWEAYVNGKSAEVLRTNFIFRGVIVPKGDYTITMRYRPRTFSYGCIGSGIGLVLAAGVAVYIDVRRRRQFSGYTDKN